MTEATKLYPISNCDNPNAEGDIVFIHGLGGDAKSTWHPEGKRDDDNFWPVWLGEDLPNLKIWTLDYEAEPSHWKGQTLTLVDSAIDVLSTLDMDIGERPIFFITHSMGGLLVKQMLRQGLEYGKPRWKKITEQTKGITYISTPHLGSDIANLVSYVNNFLLKTLRLSINIEELKACHSNLHDLVLAHRNQDILKRIPIEVYVETLNTMGVRVVDKNSADPGIAGVIPEPIRGEDHISICRLKSKEARLYRKTKRFIEETLQSQKPLPELQSRKRIIKEQKNSTEEDLINDRNNDISSFEKGIDNINTINININDQH